ncbi:YwmB family TATA-box binding protein [Clostridium sp.]|uniref:YwmB family TATA-box binding protein n=1 Tax=Clostridium sp. TaxID=1506 RepID=UPI00259111EB|nr:YwmB family TATA-box binding protein [Clostridium sp.]MDF2503790.1 hypothetical protein [Clostridium sp.]
MKIKKNYIFLVVIISITFFMESVLAVENKDIINEVLNRTESVPIEVGVTTYYNINSNGKDECIKWLKSMNLYDKTAVDNVVYKNNYDYVDLLKTANDVQVTDKDIKDKDKHIENKITINDEKVYCREFQSGDIYGYIESRKDGNANNMSLFIRRINEKNNINSLEKQVMKSIDKEANNVISYKYIKAKISNDDVKVTQTKIENYLKNIGSKNISTVEINTGFSTVAYTNKYAPISDNGKLIDFNCAVIKASDGNYIILGTPIIDITY